MRNLPTLEEMRTVKPGSDFTSLLQLIIYGILAIIAIAITI